MSRSSETSALYGRTRPFLFLFFLFDADDFKGDCENRIRDRIVPLAMVFLE